MIALLQKPCPVNTSLRHVLGAALAVGLFIWLFMLAFLPFGSHNIPPASRPLQLAGFGAITTLVMLACNSWLRQHLMEPRREQQWVVWKQIVFVTLQITAIALGNFLYGVWMGYFSFSVQGLLSLILFTFAIGLFPTMALTLVNYIRHLRRNLALAASTNQQLAAQQPHAPRQEQQLLSLLGENKEETVGLALHQLLYLSAAGNYVEVVWQQDGTIKKQLLRSSLGRLEGQLEEYSLLRRCHRSFLVNLQHIARVSGNAQGYLLHLQQSGLSIPVGRSYAPDILRQIKNRSV